MHKLAQFFDNSTDLTIRTAGDGDRDFLKRLYASTRDDLRQLATDPAFVDSLIAMQQNMQAIAYGSAYPDAEYLVLEHRGEAVGRIIVNTGGGEMRLVDIAFMPRARGKGFGTAVVRALQQGAGQEELPLTLSVHRDNARARNFYAALGFRLASCNELAEQMVWARASETG